MTRKHSYLTIFLKHQTAPGVLLIGAAFFAMILANSPLHVYYDLLFSTPVTAAVGALVIDKPLLLWVNDGLMAIFFLLVGLELKRELLVGELSRPSNIILPAVGAIGGMAVPAAIYYYINKDNPEALAGWAIPAATDIAFALGVLAILGSRVPVTLKIFLTSIAIFDDVGAILIIAFFYTTKISMTSLVVSAICCVLLFVVNRCKAKGLKPYLFLGAIMWVALLKSGVHATLAGVILAFFIPLNAEKVDGKPGHSPLRYLEHELHVAVSFFILPIFAFANSGIRFSGMGFDALMHPVTLGVASGLFFGKQIGVFLFCGALILLGVAKFPLGMRWIHLYGVAALCGIGFTMSLFIGSLAFEESGINQIIDERLGIVCGSVLSALVGFLVLRSAKPEKAAQIKPAANKV